MRHCAAGLCVLVLGACSEPDTRLVEAEVQWMEWPAEVLAATPFSVRLVGYGPGCYAIQELRVPVGVDASAVTFTPYFLVSHDNTILCYYRADPAGVTAAATPPIDVGYFDTRAPVPGLTVSYPRTYEIRASAPVFAQAAAAAALPVRTFGEVTVQTSFVDSIRTNGAGMAYAYRDETGCPRLAPPFTYPSYVIENPPDTTSFWSGFVRGYVYTAATPLCGDSAVRIFHLVSRQ